MGERAYYVKNNLGKKQKEFLLEQMDTLRKKGSSLYKFYYFESGDTIYQGDQDKDWELVKKCFSKVDNMDWGKKKPLLACCQAEACSIVGSVYKSRCDYDRALKYLKRAKEIIEINALQKAIPVIYAEVYFHMGKCYMEKHMSVKEIKACHKQARKVLDQVLEQKETEFPMESVRKLYLELILQQAISGLDVFGQQEDQNNKFLFSWKCLCIAKEKLEEFGDLEDTRWKKKQRCTLQATMGELFRQLYFKIDLICQDMGEKDTIKMLNDICGWLEENKKDRAENSDIDRYMLSISEIRKRIQNLDMVLYRGGLEEEQKEIVEALRKHCFQKAFSIFAKKINDNADNTICMGNMAGLLYDYITTKRGYGDRERAFLRFVIKKEQENFGENLSLFPTEKEEYNIQILLDKVLKTERNNMYALDLKAALYHSEKDFSIKNKREHYPALRQSALKKRFLRMDEMLKNVDSETMQEIKICLIILHSKVVDFMNSAIIDFDHREWKHLKVGHYTRQKVLPKLINKQPNSIFRIYNVHHLNDPLEGVLFVQRVLGSLKEKGGVIDELNELYDSEKNGAARNCVYMGSFTSSLDNLNMWSQYGDGCRGVCLQVDATKSFDKSTKIALAENSSNNDSYQYKLEDIKYPLYMVVYIPEGTDDEQLRKAAVYAGKMAEASKAGEDGDNCEEKDFKEKERKQKEQRMECLWWQKQKELIEDFCELKNDLGSILKKINDLSQKLEVKEERRGELRREICNTIMVIMDLARFLLKSVNYRDEREYRVIQYSSNPKCDEECGDIPRLYVEMERPIVYSKVCFGPLTSNFDSVAAYVRNIKKDGKEIEERVHWDIEVCKSEISYR